MKKRKKSRPLPDIRPVDPANPPADAIRDAARIIRAGGIVVLPTRSLYGLCADARNPNAVSRIFDIKGRSSNKPILLLISDERRLDGLVSEIPALGRVLMDRFWPGKLTIVFKAGALVSDRLTGGTGNIGIRLCAHGVTRAVIHEAGVPVTGTSANLSGRPGCADIRDLNPAVRDSADLILDAGPLSGGSPSTVVDISDGNPVILREGIVTRRDLREFI